MQARHQTYFTLLLLVIVLHSCGKNGDIVQIRALEERMAEASGPQEKSELANRLHRAYSLYHLQNEGDTLFLRQWARMAEAGKEYEQAIDVYTILLERDPGLPGIYAARGRLYAGLGYYHLAANDFDEAGQKLRAHDDAKKREYARLSEYYQKADSVIRREGELIAAGGSPERHLLNRAAQFLECGYYRAAMADIDAVLGVDSVNARAHFLRALAYMGSGEYERSEEAFQSFFFLAAPGDEYFSEAQKQRQRMGQLVQLDALERSLGREPYAYESLVDAAATAFRLEAYDKARVYATRLTEVYPDSIFGYLYRGQVGIQTGNLEQAREDMNRVLELEPSNISARNLKGYILLLGKEYTLLQQEITEIRSRGGEVFEVLRPYAAEQ